MFISPELPVPTLLTAIRAFSCMISVSVLILRFPPSSVAIDSSPLGSIPLSDEETIPLANSPNRVLAEPLIYT